MKKLDFSRVGEQMYHEKLENGLNDTPEELAARYETVTREQVAAAARKLELDTIYFLKGKEV